MDKGDSAPAFIVYKVTMSGVVPLARYYHCAGCERDLSKWIMQQTPGEASACPHCEIPIDAQQIAQAQRETKMGCFYTIASIALLFFGLVALVAVIWLVTGLRRPT
jgi:DNA-directed RNA polymerase subunit RPC12/RpoP